MTSSRVRQPAGGHSHVLIGCTCARTKTKTNPKTQVFSFVLDKPCDEWTRPQYYDTLKDRFVRQSLAPERTKALVFVFVLAHEQAITTVSFTLIGAKLAVSYDFQCDYENLQKCNNESPWGEDVFPTNASACNLCFACARIVSFWVLKNRAKYNSCCKPQIF